MSKMSDDQKLKELEFRIQCLETYILCLTSGSGNIYHSIARERIASREQENREKVYSTSAFHVRRDKIVARFVRRYGKHNLDMWGWPITRRDKTIYKWRSY